MSTYVYGQPDHQSLPHHYTTQIPMPYSPALSTPPRSITVSRTHSFSTDTLPRRSSVSTGPLPQTPGEQFRFDTSNPFGSVPRQRSTLTPIRSGESEEGHVGRDEGEERPPMRGRLMSFEDMLDGPKPGKGDPS
jgi:hypothetical protein